MAILCESPARLGVSVTGIDPSENGISVAREHAKSIGLKIEYHVADAEAFLEYNKKEAGYDAINIVKGSQYTRPPLGVNSLESVKLMTFVRP